MTYDLRPIDAVTANELRDSGGETYVADAKPGFPCRQCLRDAEVGEELVLVSFDPFTIDSPYRSASPIFLHRHDCGPPASTSPLPPQLTRRLLSVRAFDAEAMMIGATVIDGEGLAAAIDSMFDDERTDRLHVHNAERGCYAAAVVRVR